MDKGENNRSVGFRYERISKDFLIQKGYRILSSNFVCRQGEIDLIAENDGYLVFIEVKYRKNDRFGSPEAAVTKTKQDRIRKAAKYYMFLNNYSADTPCRFDVVGILKNEISVTENAFW